MFRFVVNQLSVTRRVYFVTCVTAGVILAVLMLVTYSMRVLAHLVLSPRGTVKPVPFNSYHSPIVAL